MPVFKKENNYEMIAFCPDTQLRLLGKVFEDAVCCQVIEYLEHLQLLSPLQQLLKKLYLENCFSTSQQITVFSSPPQKIHVARDNNLHQII